MSLPDWRALVCLGLSAAAGAGARSTGLPLAWVLGPMLVTAAFAIADIKVIAPVIGRRTGQLIIGATVGLSLTGEVLVGLVGWLPLMVLTAFSGLLIAAAFGVVFARAAKLDHVTGFFAVMPGGLSEMANIGLAQGARPEPIALSHAIRVAIVVGALPPLFTLFGDDLDAGAWTARQVVPAASLPLIVAVALIGSLVFRRIGFQNPWMIGPLTAVAALAASGFVDGRMPVPLMNVGQFMLGIAIGARFKGEIIRSLLPLTIICSLTTVGLTLAMIAYSVMVAKLTALDVRSLILSSAPGGLAEMVITAQVLHLQPALVTGFHIVRSFTINGLSLPIFNLLERGGFFLFLNKLLDRHWS